YAKEHLRHWRSLDRGRAPTMLAIESEIRELERLEEHGGEVPLLSVYLIVDMSLAAGQNLHAQFTTLAKQLRAEVDQTDLSRLNAELGRAEAYITSRPVEGRSICIFSGGANDLFSTFTLSARVPTGAYWGTSPYLRPLRAILDEHEPVLVILVDAERARRFRMQLNDIVELSPVRDWVPSRHRQTGGTWAPAPGMWGKGGWGDSGISRKREEHLLAHIRHVLDQIRSDLSEYSIGRIIIGGSQEATSALHTLAPRPIADRIVGEIHAELFSSPETVRILAQSVAEHAERSAESVLMEQLTEAEGQQMAVFGTDRVVDAVNSQNVYILAFVDDMELAGEVCGNCGALAATSSLGEVPHLCSACGGALDSTPDLVDALSRRVIANGGRMDGVRGDAAHLLTSRGGLAARLRWSPGVTAPA
ncbi:MAG: hypothetical protein ACKVVP_12905, partial [Chloroflexota bacterium]